tara:strand:- start:649 stop:801 length:153 start_codon:yes stop_codon:yes gene_type:complete
MVSRARETADLLTDAGRVLQVVQNSTAGGVSSTSTSYVDVTKATVTILVA